MGVLLDEGDTDDTWAGGIVTQLDFTGDSDIKKSDGGDQGDDPTEYLAKKAPSDTLTQAEEAPAQMPAKVPVEVAAEERNNAPAETSDAAVVDGDTEAGNCGDVEMTPADMEGIEGKGEISLPFDISR